MAEQADTLVTVDEQTPTKPSRSSVTVKLPPVRTTSAKFPQSKRFSRESPDKLKELERGFVLDGTVVSRLANDETGRSHPSLNMGIPQYNALHDKHCKSYFKSKGPPKSVRATKSLTSAIPEDSEDNSSMMGQVFDKFVRNSSAKQYLQEREGIGAGYTRRLYGGHLTVPTAPAFVGYHGEEGYRRNTYDLRQRRSVFDEEEDPFENPKPINRRLRTQSAPATMRLMRIKSANVYRAPPGGRAVSAMPRTLLERRDLATGPVQ